MWGGTTPAGGWVCVGTTPAGGCVCVGTTPAGVCVCGGGGSTPAGGCVCGLIKSGVTVAVFSFSFSPGILQ